MNKAAELEPHKSPRLGTRGEISLVILAVIAVGTVVTWLGPILKPFLTAVFLYFATRSLARFLISRGWPAWLAYVTLFLTAVLLASLLTLYIYSEGAAFRREWPDYQERLVALVGTQANRWVDSVDDIFQLSTSEAIRFAFEQSVGMIEFVLMTFFYLLFMILGGQRLPQKVKRALPPERSARVLRIANEISLSIEQFMRVKTLVSLGMGSVVAALCFFFGLKQWLLWGFAFFALNYITYLGSIAACVPPILMGFVEIPSFGLALTLAILIVINRVLWIDFLEIRMSGQRLDISSVLIFLWLAYWGWVWGVMGLILAYPMIVSLKLALMHFEGTKGYALLMSET
ncbi:MAG: AI-2E family transporter [Pirellulaceae bacterium]